MDKVKMKKFRDRKMGFTTWFFLWYAIVATTAYAANIDDDIRALRATIASNSVTRTSKGNRYYLAYYREGCTRQERDAILERNIAAHRRWIELAGERGTKPQLAAMPRAELGKVLAIGGRWKEAEKELREALRHDFDKSRMAEARWALAECLWRRKDKEGAKKLIADIVAMEWNGDAPRAWHKAIFMHHAWTDPDADLDMMKLPHSVDGKPFPTPQRAEYGDANVSLAKVEIDFREEGKWKKEEGLNDPIVRLLKRKLQRFGTKFVEVRSRKEEVRADVTTIELELSADAPIDKPQGYVLEVRRKKEEGKSNKEEGRSTGGVVLIKARDRLGLTWGVVSFLQCVNRGDTPQKPSSFLPLPSSFPSIRTLRIDDWPKLERRGVIEAFWYPDFLEFALFHKMSMITAKLCRPECSFIFSSLERERCRLTVKRYRDFGIETYWSARELSVSPVLPLSSPRTRDLHLAWWRCAAIIDANVCFEMDDERFFGFPDEDKKSFGTAANMDSKYLTSLYREVKAEFPNFHLIFGTPFYFGPDGGLDPSWYPEPRDEYLKSHREFLDPEIGIYWSGPRVKSGGFTPAKIKWFSDLVGRRPFIYHNGDCVGRHGHISFGADVPNFKGSHCPEALDLIEGLEMNMTHYNETPKVGACMDWCWNPDAHDPAVATRRTDEQMEGPGVFEILAAATPSLSYFDKYQYGTPRSELFAEDLADLEKRIADADKAWKEVLAIARNGGRYVGGFNGLGLRWARKLTDMRRNPPKWLTDKCDAEMKNTKFAKSEVGFDESKGDQFIPSELMQGGVYNPKQNDRSGQGPRGIKYVSVGTEVAMNFRCDDYPPESPPKLVVVGMAFKAGLLPDMEIEVNGKSVWRGKAFEVPYCFKPLEVVLPVSVLQRTNRLVLRNMSPTEETERKTLIHYVVVKK